MDKICKCCSRHLLISAFRVDRSYVTNTCKECYRSYQSLYRKKNQLKIKQTQVEWYAINKVTVISRVSKRTKERSRVDSLFRVRNCLRTRLYTALKSNKATFRTMELLGCSIKELKLHLEKQFKPGMSWENQGKWHVDHIKPISSFNLALESEIKIAFHFSNLQSLWARENLIKGAKCVV